MSNARLLAVTIEGFKSYRDRTRVDLAPITVLVGRNNGGKSTLLQAILLLKQTLADPRSEVPLGLEGLVEAFNLRELTFGWPGPGERVVGPSIEVEWQSDVDVNAARAVGRWPDPANLARHTRVPWFLDPPARARFGTSLRIDTAEVHGTTVVEKATLRCKGVGGERPYMSVTRDGSAWRCEYGGVPSPKITVEMDHFIPYLRVDRSTLGPRDAQRAWHNAYLVLFAQPLEDLRRLLAEFQYLGSTRSPPPSLFRPSTVAPQEIGVSGEYAAQLLHRRRHDVVHYLPPLRVEDHHVAVPDVVRARRLEDAVNDVLEALSVTAPLKVEEIQDVGFRLLFGNASLPHVGRGLTYLLPLVELGLLADPLRFADHGEEMPVAKYLSTCGSCSHIAFEEPEAHLHPKVQSRLAHWLVSLARSNRRLVVETHSDHLVRRLRGLVARSGPGSDLELWLLENVVIHEVEQGADGQSFLRTGRLTAEGGVGETWPADFMDEAGEEDTAIYDAGMAKRRREDPPSEDALIIHDEGPEPEVES